MGDEEPVKAWKFHNGECHLIHQKVDIIASRLGVSFFVARKGPEEVAHPRDNYGKCGKKKKWILSPLQPGVISPGLTPAPAQSMVSFLPSAFKKMV